MMTLQNTLPTRFTKIDELTLHEHFHLTEEDECYFLGLYTAYGGYSYSDTNKTIFNFKKKLDRRGKSDWIYKGHAIHGCARAFREAVNAFELDAMTFVPVPPAHIKNDPLYDDRLIQMLQYADPSRNLDVRECVVQIENTRSSHESEDRLSPTEIANVYKFRKYPDCPRPKLIAIVDDILTTGAHFKVMKGILLNQFPNVKVIGFFLARREIPSSNKKVIFL